MKISIKYKAAILIALTELLLLGILLFSNLQGSRQNLEQQLDTQAMATAELVGNAATSPLLSLDLAQLQTQLDGVIGKHNIKAFPCCRTCCGNKGERRSDHRGGTGPGRQ